MEVLQDVAEQQDGRISSSGSWRLPAVGWHLRRWPGYLACWASVVPWWALGRGSCVPRQECWPRRSARPRRPPAGRPPEESVQGPTWQNTESTEVCEILIYTKKRNLGNTTEYNTITIWGEDVLNINTKVFWSGMSLPITQSYMYFPQTQFIIQNTVPKALVLLAAC